MKNKLLVVLEQDTDMENPREEYDSHLGKLYTWHKRYCFGNKKDEENKEPITDMRIWAFDNFNELANKPELVAFRTCDGYLINDDDEEPSAEEISYFNHVVDLWMEENFVYLKVYLYDHSGLSVQTTPFSCPWDSGCVGIIYTTLEECRKEQVKLEKAEIILKSEIEVLNQYLNGDVWSYTLYVNDNSNEEFDEESFYWNEILLDTSEFICYSSGEHPDSPDWIFVDSCGGIYGHNDALGEATNTMTHFIESKGRINQFLPKEV